MNPVRGQVVQVPIEDVDEPKLFVIVSNNERNRKLPTVLGCRLTTSRRNEQIRSIIELPNTEQVHGRVLCDAITEIWTEDIMGVRTALSPAAMRKIGEGLAVALAL